MLKLRAKFYQSFTYRKLKDFCIKRNIKTPFNLMVVNHTPAQNPSLMHAVKSPLPTNQPK